MKKLLAVTACVAGILSAGSAQADYGEIFNVNQQNLDSSLQMRQSTTEQFDPVRGQSVADRPRPDFDPVPVPMGGFQLFPAVNFGTYYDSNIFGTGNATTGDEVWKLNPTATLASNWGRNAVALTGLGDFNYYTNNNEQNYAAGALQAEGRYDISEQTWLAGDVGYQRVAEMRGGPLTPGNTVGPSEYDLYSAGAEAYRGVGRLKTSLDFNSSYYGYDNVGLIGGGNLIQTGRDRVENSTSAEAGYDVTQNFQPFVRGAYSWNQYTGGGPNSSNGYKMDVGTKMDLGGVTTAKAYIGYMAQNFVNYNNGVVDAIDFGADLLWNVTSLTSVEGKASRSIQESDTIGSPAILDSQGSVTVTHELMRNLILETSVTYYSLDFQKTTEHDDLWDTGAGARWYFNRRLYSDLTYDYEGRSSTVHGVDYNRHVLFARIGFQY